MSGTVSKRRGFTMIEAQVALVVFGIALAGLCPFAVWQLRAVRKLETGLDAGTTYYLAPRSDDDGGGPNDSTTWLRKLGASASLSTTAPSGSSSGGKKPKNVVTVLAIDAPSTSENITVLVSSVKAH